MRKNLTRIHAAAVALALGAGLLLSACGGGDSGEHLVKGFSYELRIAGAEVQSSAAPQYLHALDSEGWYLEGDGFLPPETTCAQRSCQDSMGYVSSAYLGQHELTWENQTSGESGIISQGSKFESSLYWYCYCEMPPYWSTRVPIVAGLNHIIVTQRAGILMQRDEVDVILE